MEEVSALKAVLITMIAAAIVMFVMASIFPTHKADMNSKYDIFASSSSYGNLACKNMTVKNTLKMVFTCPETTVTPINGKCDIATMQLYVRICSQNSECKCNFTYYDYPTTFSKGEARNVQEPCSSMADEFLLNSATLSSMLGSALMLKANPFTNLIDRCLGKTQETHKVMYKEGRGLAIGILVMHVVDTCLLVYLMFLLYAAYDCTSVLLEVIWLVIDLLVMAFCVFLIWQFNTALSINGNSSNFIVRAKREVSPMEQCVVVTNTRAKATYKGIEIPSSCVEGSIASGNKTILYKDNKVTDLNGFYSLFKECVTNQDSVYDMTDFLNEIEGRPNCRRVIRNIDKSLIRKIENAKAMKLLDSLEREPITPSYLKEAAISPSSTYQPMDFFEAISPHGMVLMDDSLGAGPNWWSNLPWGSIVKMIHDLLRQCFGDDSNAILILLNYGKYVNMFLFAINIADACFIIYTAWDEYKSFTNTVLVIKMIRLAFSILFAIISLVFLLVESSLIKVIKEGG